MAHTSEFVYLVLAGLFFASLAFYLHLRLFSRFSLSSDLPWAGSADGGCLSRALSTLRSIFSTRELLNDGYYKYSKHDKPFVLPNILAGPEVIIPMSQFNWLLEQPESICSQNEVNRQFLQADHTMLHPNVIKDTVHGDVIRKELTKQLGDYTDDVWDELDLAMRQCWGVGTNWKEVPVYYTMAEIISRLSNRVLVGKPLCRNETYLENSSRFARGVVIAAAIISMIPKILKPYLAPLITWYDRRFYFNLAKFIMPIIHQRLKLPVGKLDKEYSIPQRNDYIQWAISHAVNHDNPEERTPDMISKRLAVLTFAAIQSSAITLTNLIFDLASSPLAELFQAEMREEVIAVLRHEDETKKTLARLYKVDSALRESMRLRGFVSRGVSKMVVVPNGVTLPDGTHVPYGVRVGVAAYPVHHDEAIYPRAETYDAFRFSGTRSKVDNDRGGLTRKITSLVTTSSSFMAFSHGRHACPGRFFAAQQLKLTLAYIALNYDIEPIPTRPENQWLVGSMGPPMHETIRIRRRLGTNPCARDL